jgi:chromosomal replication initiation ATPase DnaA
MTESLIKTLLNAQKVNNLIGHIFKMANYWAGKPGEVAATNHRKYCYLIRIAGLQKIEAKERLLFAAKKDIIRAVCYEYNTTLEQLCVRSRKGHIVLPRQLIMHFLKLQNKYTLQQIADVFISYDHATVINAHKTIKNWLDTDKAFRAKYDKIVSKF